MIDFVRSRSVLALLTATLGSPALAQDEPTRASPPPPAATAPAATQPAESAPSPRKDLPAPKDILQRSIDAMGGREAFDAVKSVATKASVNSPMGTMTLEMNWMAPNLILVKQMAGDSGSGTSIGSDGVVTWAKGPLDCQILPNEQARQIQQQASTFLLVHRIESDQVELKTLDQVKFGEHDCFKVYGKDADGIESIFYFDAKDYLIRGGETTMPSQMGEVTQIVRFGEWKQDAGIKYFTKLDIEQMGMTIGLTMTDVQFNSLEASMFTLPDEVKAMLKARESQPSTTTAPATSQPTGGN